MNSASAALALIAALFAALQSEIFAQGVEERGARINPHRALLAIDFQFHGNQRIFAA